MDKGYQRKITKIIKTYNFCCWSRICDQWVRPEIFPTCWDGSQCFFISLTRAHKVLCLTVTTLGAPRDIPGSPGAWGCAGVPQDLVDQGSSSVVKSLSQLCQKRACLVFQGRNISMKQISVICELRTTIILPEYLQISFVRRFWSSWTCWSHLVATSAWASWCSYLMPTCLGKWMKQQMLSG